MNLGHGLFTSQWPELEETENRSKNGLCTKVKSHLPMDGTSKKGQ